MFVLLDRSSYVPYYMQIKEHLQSSIERNEYPVGHKLPSESELMRLFGVSRITVRQAIESLTQGGYVEKKQGKGAFVSQAKAAQEPNVIASWTELMRARGLRPETRAFSCSEIPATERLAETLQIKAFEPVYCLESLRYCNGEPVCIMKNYIPVKTAPGLIQKDQIRSGIYSVLENDYGLRLATAVEAIEARPAGSREAELLHIRRGSPVLIVQRVTSDPGGVPVEFVTTASAADKYAYIIRLEGRPNRN